MNTPWLVQRGTIHNAGPDLPCESKSIDALVSWDYMGSAEYEFGALNKSLKCIRAEISKYNHHHLSVAGKSITVSLNVK